MLLSVWQKAGNDNHRSNYTFWVILRMCRSMGFSFSVSSLISLCCIWNNYAGVFAVLSIVQIIGQTLKKYFILRRMASDRMLPFHIYGNGSHSLCESLMYSTIFCCFIWLSLKAIRIIIYSRYSWQQIIFNLFIFYPFNWKVLALFSAKFGGRTGNGPMRNPLKVGADPGVLI